jgi:hypothetical protein
LLEGGLDWKPLSMTPKDMDFIEAKNSAAREIALALGMPPMLLGIPGDNTYSNYREASRALWRQTVLPLVNRTAKAMSAWLAESDSYASGQSFGNRGATLEFRPDLDNIEALTSEREALWTRLEAASFLTDDEKRAVIGYGPKDGGQAAKFNPNHDELGRFTSPGGSVAPGNGGAEITEDKPASGDGKVRVAEAGSGTGSMNDATPSLVEQVGGRATRRVTIGGREFLATEAEITELELSISRLNISRQKFEELAPGEYVVPGLTGGETARGEIEANRLLAQQYEARVTVIQRGGVPLGFNSMEEFRGFSWDARSSLALSGNSDAEPYLRGSAVTGYRYETGEPFDSGYRSDLDFALVSPRLMERAQQLSVPTMGQGTRTVPLPNRILQEMGLYDSISQMRTQTGRRGTFVIFKDLESLTKRGPYLQLP